MPPADLGKQPTGYQLPEARLKPDEEHALAKDIQRRIEGIGQGMQPRLNALVAAVIKEPGNRTRRMPEAVAGLRKAIVAHTMDCPNEVGQFTAHLRKHLATACEEPISNDFQDLVTRHFELIDGDATAFQREVTGVNELASHFVACNMRLVAKLAREFSSSGLSFEDLCQEGAIALRRAALSFQPGTAASFGTFAWRIVQNHLLDVVRTAQGISDHETRRLEEFWSAQVRLGQDLQRAATDDEVFDHLKWSPAVRLSLQSALRLVRPSSIPEECSGDAQLAEGETTQCPEHRLIETEDSRCLAKSLTTLTVEEQTLVNQHFHLGQSLRDIAREKGHKNDHSVRKTFHGPISKLKAALTPEPPAPNSRAEGSDAK